MRRLSCLHHMFARDPASGQIAQQWTLILSIYRFLRSTITCMDDLKYKSSLESMKAFSWMQTVWVCANLRALPVQSMNRALNLPTNSPRVMSPQITEVNSVSWSMYSCTCLVRTRYLYIRGHLLIELRGRLQGSFVLRIRTHQVELQISTIFSLVFVVCLLLVSP